MTTHAPQLRPVSANSSLRAYVGELFSRREFILSVPKHDLHAQNMDTLLGNVWYLLNPLLFTVVYYVIFGLLLDAARGVDSYVTYMVIGVLIMNYFGQAVSKAAETMPRKESLIRSLYFPRAAIPFSESLTSFYIFLPSVVAMLGMALVMGIWPTWRWLMLPVVFLIIGVFVTGVDLIFARIGAKFRDLASIVPHLVRLLFYSSGTIYDPEVFTTNTTILRAFKLNPLYEMLSLCRWAVMGRPVPASFWVAATLWAVVTFVVGFVFFWKGELTYGSTQ